MATTEIATEPEAEVMPGFPPHLMTVERYERVVEAGIYGPSDPLFLWDGRLVEERSKGHPHSFTPMSLLYILFKMLPDGWHAAHDLPLSVGPVSMPEPDLMIVRGQPRDYLGRSRTARDVAIVVEVADSSVPQDSVTKLRAYAADGVPIYWVANLPDQRVFVHSDPSGPSERPDYRECREYGPADEIPIILDGVEIGRVAVGEILP